MRAPPASIKVRALQWLAQREHSRDELKRKLLHLLTDRTAEAGAAEAGASEDGAAAAAGADPERAVEELLAWLEQHGYLSQQRFVESRVHARASRFGNLRIQHELQQHGLAVDDQTEQALRASEFDRAREVWRKKYGHIAGDAAGRVRQMRFLSGRGFSADVVRRVVRGADEEPGS